MMFFFFFKCSLVVALFLLQPSTLCSALPAGFVEDVVAQVKAVSGVFAPNPRNNRTNTPMLLLTSKQGQIYALEHIVEEDGGGEEEEAVLILDMEEHICENSERGLQSIAVHPNFGIDDDNYWIYIYYTEFKEGCLEGADIDDILAGPQNILARFQMDPETLQLDFDERDVLWKSPPALNSIHNGGALDFGKADGKIYLTTGDSGESPEARKLFNTFGAIIRLNDDGSVPDDNPFSDDNNSHHCSETNGRVPQDLDDPDDAVCKEIFAYGFRNPFRMSMMDPSSSAEDKVLFTVQDVGAAHHEEISFAGTDYAGRNYGWPRLEGPCRRGSITDCPFGEDENFVDPFHYYAHRSIEEGGCVTGGVFVPPQAGWPSRYKYLFIDYIFLKIFNLVEDPDAECKADCRPPVSAYRNETFYDSIQIPGQHVNSARMTELLFGPYINKNGNDTQQQEQQALYVIRRGNLDTVLRIRYTGNLNRPPVSKFVLEKDNYGVNETIYFNSTESSDPEGESLSYYWTFGDDDDASASEEANPTHFYSVPGEYLVTLVVTDSEGQEHQSSLPVLVGSLPVATIVSPAQGDDFFVGQQLRLVGQAVDALGNVIPTDRLEWEVRQHHADHFHPFLSRTSGNDLDLYPAPEPEDFWAATNSFLKVLLYATDENGLTAVVERDVMPQIVMVDIETNPAGLRVIVDDYEIDAPQRVTSWINYKLPVMAAESQPPYRFSHWNHNHEDPNAGTTATTNQTILLQSGAPPSVIAVFCIDDDQAATSDALFDCTTVQCCTGTCVEGSCVEFVPTTTVPPTMSPTRVVTDDPTLAPQATSDPPTLAPPQTTSDPITAASSSSSSRTQSMFGVTTVLMVFLLLRCN